MEDVGDGEVLEVAEPDGYFFDEDVSYGPGDAEFFAAFFCEVESSYPPGVIFSFVVEIEFLFELVFVHGVDLVLLEVDVAIGLIFPEGDLVRGASHAQPVVRIEHLGIVLVVAHYNILTYNQLTSLDTDQLIRCYHCETWLIVPDESKWNKKEG